MKPRSPKPSVLDTLAENVGRFVGRNDGQQGSSTLGPKAGVDPKTLTNWKNKNFGPQGPTLKKVENVAHALGASAAWELLVPDQDIRCLEVISIYKTADAVSKYYIDAALEAAKNKTNVPLNEALGGLKE
jgi:hypothetical protein